ncbi:MAG: hypothetical protein PHE18_05630 [Candidatus Omnitrophica bacterium]|nr:hypothetical protein [Candidatus Omnitrophota bacterium]MDD5553337.1 hypothetical protein [Candidatus Omnitrophota bacterium]
MIKICPRLIKIPLLISLLLICLAMDTCLFILKKAKNMLVFPGG